MMIEKRNLINLWGPIGAFINFMKVRAICVFDLNTEIYQDVQQGGQKQSLLGALQSKELLFFVKKGFMGDQSRISTDKAPKPVGSYPHARRVGNLLFLSGVGPRNAGSDATDSGVNGLSVDKNGHFDSFDFEAQCHAVFQNVRAVLEASGSSWDKLVDVTVFLVDMKRDFKIYNRIYAEYFKDNQPCRTTVEINALPTPIAIELKCIATID